MKRSVLKKKTIKKTQEISQEERIKIQQQELIQKQKEQLMKQQAEEEYKKQLEEQKLDLIEELKTKLFKLNRNLNIAIEKEKLLQSKIYEMQNDIDYYKDQLKQLGGIYDENDENDEIN
jgi:hypothetical protein